MEAEKEEFQLKFLFYAIKEARKSLKLKFLTITISFHGRTLSRGCVNQTRISTISDDENQKQIVGELSWRSNMKSNKPQSVGGAVVAANTTRP
jgi:adenosylmethionine-8-amino-7-oxononanoate aminotransferase